MRHCARWEDRNIHLFGIFCDRISCQIMLVIRLWTSMLYEKTENIPSDMYALQRLWKPAHLRSLIRVVTDCLFDNQGWNTTMTQIKLCGCVGWFESSLGSTVRRYVFWCYGSFISSTVTLDRSISSKRGVCLDFVITMIYRNSSTSCKQCRLWSDGAFCGVWSGSTLFAIYGTQCINGLNGWNICGTMEICSRHVLVQLLLVYHSASFIGSKWGFEGRSFNCVTNGPPYRVVVSTWKLRWFHGGVILYNRTKFRSNPFSLSKVIVSSSWFSHIHS